MVTGLSKKPVKQGFQIWGDSECRRAIPSVGGRFRVLKGDSESRGAGGGDSDPWTPFLADMLDF